jgi:hypothetical protein
MLFLFKVSGKSGSHPEQIKKEIKQVHKKPGLIMKYNHTGCSEIN